MTADGPAVLARVRAALKAPARAPARLEAGLSAVLVPLFANGNDGLRVMFTRRSEDLSSHPGEVSFPGGRLDPGDDGALAAALRETHEEVGIAPHQVDVLGHVADLHAFRGGKVAAYAGFVPGEPSLEPASPDEVAEIFTVPLERLLGPDHYEGRCFEGYGLERVVHYWFIEPWTVWGLTGSLTARFLSRAFDWKPPHPPRVIQDVSEFLPQRSTHQP